MRRTSDDPEQFCLIHEYDFMMMEAGNPIHFCAKCEAQKPMPEKELDRLIESALLEGEAGRILAEQEASREVCRKCGGTGFHEGGVYPYRFSCDCAAAQSE